MCVTGSSHQLLHPLCDSCHKSFWWEIVPFSHRSGLRFGGGLFEELHNGFVERTIPVTRVSDMSGGRVDLIL